MNFKLPWQKGPKALDGPVAWLSNTSDWAIVVMAVSRLHMAPPIVVVASLPYTCEFMSMTSVPSVWIAPQAGDLLA